MSLQGKRVLVTRAADDAAELEQLLRARAAVPVRFPCIEFEDGPDAGRILEAVRARPDLIVVSSPHAARRLVDLIGRTSAPDLIGRTSAPVRFAAVGAATAALLPGDVIVPEVGAGAEALLAVLAPQVAGKRVLVPRAEHGTPALIDGLTRAGAAVEVFTLYRTVTPKSGDLSLLRDVAAVSFASGSAVRGFVQLAGAEAANRAAVACIGASTAGEARAAGIRIDACGDDGLETLCDALALAVAARKG